MAEREECPWTDSAGAPQGQPAPDALRETQVGDGTQDTLETLWQNVDAHWAQSNAHDAFLQACVDRGMLGEAARRYGTQQAVQGREELTAKRLELVTFLAVQQMQAQHAGKPRQTLRWITWFAAVACLGAVGVLVYVLLSR